jgi:hypothetical protein
MFTTPYCNPNIYATDSAYYRPYNPTDSTYYRPYNPTAHIVGAVNNLSIFKIKLISKDNNKPCYKTYIRNIEYFLAKNDVYNNSKKKELIVDNINKFICEYGKNKEESIKNMEEKIEYNIKMYADMKKSNKTINKMSHVLFETLSAIKYELS